MDKIYLKKTTKTINFIKILIKTYYLMVIRISLIIKNLKIKIKLCPTQKMNNQKLKYNLMRNNRVKVFNKEVKNKINILNKFKKILPQSKHLKNNLLKKK
jgi:hypothetical protein